MINPIPKAQDIDFPGKLDITVDATDLDHRIFAVSQNVPVSCAGDLVLLLPKWLPGKHAPGAELSKIAGIKVSTGDKSLTWTRDPVEVNGFHIDVPEGVTAIKVEFQYLSATEARNGRIVMTHDMLNLQWNFAAFYPAGYYVSRILVQASLKLPTGWGYGTALETQSRFDDGQVVFKETSFETLIDSPVYAGRYYKAYDLDPDAKTRVTLNVVADRPELLNASDEVITIHRNLIQQAYKLYGSLHYDHYDFLASFSDYLGRNGLEHHRSSENGLDPKYFTDWNSKYVGRDLLAHEFTHSWNGKFRRGVDLWTPDYQVPMRTSLLWVYEGQTEYWGNVLAARSGLYSNDQAIEYLAIIAAAYNNLPGRSWRYLEDTTNDPIIGSRWVQSWPSYQRWRDYYSEGLLIWFDVDTLIRDKTGNKKSLDDFAIAFFGIKDGDWGTVTYKFDDIVTALNDVYAYDWETFFKKQLYGHAPGAPLDGFTRGGYKLVYKDMPTDFYKAVETDRKSVDLTYSIGATLNKDGLVTSILWDGPLFKAGLSPGVQLVAVNGKTFAADDLKNAITTAKGNNSPLEMLVRSEDRYRTIALDYHDGLRYPKFERIPGAPTYIDDILKARP